MEDGLRGKFPVISPIQAILILA